MQFTDGYVRQLLPLAIEDVIAVAVLLADRHWPQAHVQHQVRNATSDDDLVSA